MSAQMFAQMKELKREIEELKARMAALEAQRPVLGLKKAS